MIVISQFCCTSLWFAGNAVIGDLVGNFGLLDSALGHLTSAVQLGFIVGTLVFAFLTLADRFWPSGVFFISAISGALFNLGAIWDGNTFASLFALRFLTGFCLAGIYPVGMKIAADWFQKGLGRSLGYLVGALVVGTAFPHLLNGFSAGLPWRGVLVATSVLAAFGGVSMLLFVPNGPFRKRNQSPDFGALFKVFRDKNLSKAAMGYFGHMWELYAFWTFVPAMLIHLATAYQDSGLNVPLLSFLIIALGSLSCVAGGYWSQKMGPKVAASAFLSASGLCCLLSPLFLLFAPPGLMIAFLIFWGLMVIPDSPLLSTLVALNAKPENKATALTIVNSAGFALTIVSIQLLGLMQTGAYPHLMFLLLLPGPAVGLWAMWRG